ncbi:MAG: serine/threonine-protein kinase [Steroidobacteraceae bacterium]|nr:serine/threonine protein kinase [Nevskiaceae bacterium]
MKDLTPTRVRRLQDLFEQALDVPATERTALLDRESGNDDALREEVLALIAAHESSTTILGRALSFDRDLVGTADGSRWLGARLGPWRVTRVIGIGGMGTVCEAMRADEQFEKRVAVKFLHAHACTSSAAQGFRVERQILANLDHPNVATLLDGGVTEDGQPYLVMEYVDGEPITVWADARSLSRRARVELFLQVCAAVEAAHRNLIVHRDLKPGNILVTTDGRVKLLDFGIAQLLGDAGAASGTSSAGSVSFTPAYAAPEQMRAQPVTTAADVFSLGVVLVRLLTGRLPFEERRGVDVVAGPTGLEADLDSITAQAMCVEPGGRYSTVQELRTDLERWLNGLPVTAYSGGHGYRLAKFLRRHRVGSALAATAVAGILAMSGIALWQARAAEQAATDQRQLNAFLMEVLTMSDPFSEGDDLTLSAALDRAAESIDKRFASRPDLSAEIRFGIGYSMANRYRLEQAEVQLRRALLESEAAFGLQDVRTLRVIEGIAGVDLEASRFAEAEAGYRQVIEALRAQGRTAEPLMAKALNNLGNVYLQQENYVEADSVLRQALAAEPALTEPLTPQEHADILSNLAHAAHGIEDFARADQYYREAAGAYRELFPEGSPDLAILYNNHALLHDDRGDLQQALIMQRESLAMRRRIFRDQHPMVVSALGSISRLSLRSGDSTMALAYAAEGAMMADRVYTEPNRMHPSVHATLAAAQLATGDAPAALRSWRRASELLRGLPDAPPSIVSWVEDVRLRLCEHPAASCPAPSSVSTAPPPPR